MADDKNTHLLLSLVYSFQMQTMIQLGKLANPMNGKIEPELDAAQMTIDMLDMIKTKTKGNTTDEENRFMDQVIADLKLNYVEERDKEAKSQKSEEIPEEKKEVAEKTEAKPENEIKTDEKKEDNPDKVEKGK